MAIAQGWGDAGYLFFFYTSLCLDFSTNNKDTRYNDNASYLNPGQQSSLILTVLPEEVTAFDSTSSSFGF
ncbi:hypothetical protein Hypma_008892 [Hypsizygus marmoreus]|uniref:Uncharacterized protein n=1 Tax=Hypsizygus marmoreus TaxID=39966 RepID=A0A369JWX7_HYPMA|nr:hypothetical protein Hypma_008892 [Hypsizygus marmoreus]